MLSCTDNIIVCANCGMGEECAGDLKGCTACKMVKYCNRDCQVAHRPQHKKACRKRAAALFDEILFQDFEKCPPLECPICFLPLLGYEPEDACFHTCCGKRICNGCEIGMLDEDVSMGKRDDELGLCPFCRAPSNVSDEEEEQKRLMKQVECNNPIALYNHAENYRQGLDGYPQDTAKACEFYLKAGEFGYGVAYYNLGTLYYWETGDGEVLDKKKGRKFYELAARNGDAAALHTLGSIEGGTGNHHRGIKYYMTSAKGGYKFSMDEVKKAFINGGYGITKNEYESTLTAYQKRQDEMKSDRRDRAAAIIQLGAARGM